jgi:hypothetical protein
MSINSFDLIAVELEEVRLEEVRLEEIPLREEEEGDIVFCKTVVPV